jgi:uncharacterized protein (DUF1778 family)
MHRKYNAFPLHYNQTYLFVRNFSVHLQKKKNMKEKEEQARFDTRLPKKQKELLEKAARLGGYRSLTDFVLNTAQERAVEIIKKREQVISSERDSKIFFEAVTNPGVPNEELLSAAKEYNEKASK